MKFNFNLNVNLSLLSLLLTLITILIFIFRAKKTSLLFSFLFYQVMILMWPIPALIHNTLVSNGIYEKNVHFWGCQTFENFTTCFTGTAWVIFCLFYSNRKKVTKKLFLFPYVLLTFLLFLFSIYKNYHQDSYDEYSKEYFFLTFNILLSHIIIGIVILILNFKRQSTYMKRQATLLITAISVPLIFIISKAYLVRYGSSYITIDNIDKFFDLVPIGFTISSFVMAIATFKYSFMDIVPLAFQKVFQSIQESILIINRKESILKYNNAFQYNFGKYIDLKIKTDMEALIQNIRDDLTDDSEKLRLINWMNNPDKSGSSFELSFHGEIPRYFLVNAEPVILKNNEVIGYVFTFNNITEQKELIKELHEKYSELEAINKQLKEYASVAEALAASKERNRIARDVHDSIGHTLTSIIYLLEVCTITVTKDPVASRIKMEEILEIARDGLKQVKNSVEGLFYNHTDTDSLTDKIRYMINSFDNSGVKINFTVIGQEYLELDPKYLEAAYRICQEALTNSLRHGAPESIDILIKFIDQSIKIYIFDDGNGCVEIKKGYGLAGMEERIKCLNGTFQYGSSEEGGFFIHAEFPVIY